MSTSRENYLRAIYRLHEKSDNAEEGIRSRDIAVSLGISKASVSAMLRKLMAQEYLEISPYSRVKLPEKGIRESRRLTHNHRVIEVFLTRILGYLPQEIEAEAHELEHAFSEESVRRLDNFLNNPRKCPHGMIIPHED
jgi:DtxR family Mn-dependent transcriptional regulator